MHWLALLSLPVALAAVWLYTLSSTRTSTLRNQRIALLIAHPDDEAMFFAPTLLALTVPELNNTVQVVCLSSGNADGLGSTRKSELTHSCLRLGLPSASHVTTIEHRLLQDSMTSTWPASTISSVLFGVFPAAAPPTVIVTFDDDGVSAHPNHISCLEGARDYVRTVSRATRLYTLTTVPIWRKYLSVLDGPVSLMFHAAVMGGPAAAAAAGVGEGGRVPEGLLMVSTPWQVRTAQKAMTEAHVSQMRWFRWGWIGLSRYMVINDLVLETVSTYA